MIDHEFQPDRNQLKALGFLLLQAQTRPASPSVLESVLYDLMKGQGFGGERERWLEELEEYGLVNIEEDFSRPGYEWDDQPQMICLTPAGVYYSVSRAPLFAENWKGLTEDLPREVVDAPWPIQAYYSPLPENLAPAGDRFVRFDDNQTAYESALAAVDAVAEAIRSDNQIGGESPEFRDHKLEELKAIKTLLEKREGWSTKLIAVGWAALGYLIAKFADQPIGYAAEQAWLALQAVIGLR